jgi:hypothetical protein
VSVQTANDSTGWVARNRLISAIVLVASVVAGIAGFKDNLSKLFGGLNQPRIVFKAEMPSVQVNVDGVFRNGRFDSTVKTLEGNVGNELDFTPTDSAYFVQQVTFIYPSELGLDPKSYSNLKVEFDPVLKKVGAFLDTSAAANLSSRPGGLSYVAGCTTAIPVLIEADFIDKDSTRRANKSLYYLKVSYLEGFWTSIEALRFDRPISIMDGEKSTLESAFNNVRPTCQWVNYRK